MSGVFAKFQFGHEKMQFEIEQRLSSLVDPANNYKNLTDAWQANISINGKTYTIGDLATSHFPGLGDSYNALQSAARREFQKTLWNLAIMKTCQYYQNWTQDLTLPKGLPHQDVSKWAQDNLYKTNPGVFLRYAYTGTDNNPPATNDYVLCWWNLGIGGNELPREACKQLFMDDTPGHIINPDGLFNRRYVFEQFSLRKPNFGDWCDLSDGQKGPDFNFTGGYFPGETIKSAEPMMIRQAAGKPA